MLLKGWYELPSGLGPFDLKRGDRVLHGGRWTTVVDLYSPGNTGRGRVLHLEDGRLTLLRQDERLPTARRTPHP
ncbi:hypothetical protein [Streptomyces xiaopingdaonensis]|uniref:hypothetical protein n=1 Tax=Streptomyces xiaopingdaonensis TaxID=1565415 RepID=UPI0002DFDBB2|nr:hypothetical protein [Streptomyces xiaopingdaonensis]